MRHIKKHLFTHIPLLFRPLGVLPARVLPSCSSGAGWGGVSGSRDRGWSWRRAAPLQAGVHCPGAGGSRPTGLLTNQQIPLPPHQREHAAPSPLQHGETAERQGGREEEEEEEEDEEETEGVFDLSTAEMTDLGGVFISIALIQLRALLCRENKLERCERA